MRFDLHLLLSALATMLLSGCFTLYLSHKIAGPMVTLRNFFTDIVRGKKPIGKMHFRDRDFLMDIPPLVNDAIAKLLEENGQNKS